MLLLLAACSDPDVDPPGDRSGAPHSDGGPATPPDGDVSVDDIVRIDVLSSQPDRISGDDARIRITPLSTGLNADLTVELDGDDVTNRFRDDGDHLEGVLTGLVEGTNSLTVTGDGDAVTLRLRAWPRQGPMISGPQTPLLACSPDLADASPDTGCESEVTIDFHHLTADGELEPLDDPTAAADDVRVLDVDGTDVPAIVRIERGVVNRSAYEIAMLADDPTTDPMSPVDAAGRGTLLLRFDDGCGATHGQGELADPARNADLLEAGFAVATATFMDGSVTCNDVVSAETAMMLKERFIEVSGPPERTLGLGTGLGGGQVHLLTQTYPDLLDGGVTVDGFPDLITFANDIADCRLLLDRFEADGADWSDEERRAVTGHRSTGVCSTIDDRYGDAFDPAVGCDPAIPEDLVRPTDDESGIRCTMQDISAIPFGRDPETGAAVRPVDNIGVQYGLRALETGAISMDRFLDLNEEIGGLDPDGEIVGDRSGIDVAAVEHLYETGRIAEGAGDQVTTPFIDIVRTDATVPGDLHRALAFRHRTERIGGRRPMQQIWQLREPDDATTVDAVVSLDDWLASGRPDPDDVPDAAVSRCEPPPEADPDDDDPGDDAGDDTEEPRTVSGLDVFAVPGRDCLEADPPTDPRIVAGAPATGDVIKCELRPIDPSDYPRSLTDAELDRLERIFPTGVCDRQLPGAGQMLPSSTDRSFEDEEVPADLA